MLVVLSPVSTKSVEPLYSQLLVSMLSNHNNSPPTNEKRPPLRLPLVSSNVSGRHRSPGVSRHAWLVPVRAACPLAHAGDRAGPGVIGQLAVPAHSRRLRWRPRPA